MLMELADRVCLIIVIWWWGFCLPTTELITASARFGFGQSVLVALFTFADIVLQIWRAAKKNYASLDFFLK